ncbi:hypothetical protein [Myxococcus sp. RHSTA-1-4]|uniref:hypothetical protein n=1 Tax=Myxococcus sp. RHSTA-1-4 TaxID=2874601 RepID=UPI001CBC0A78|nr:hypothetical protein [Myxococcus sp. RHSTA-1-4]MBZ4415992.1 hypothetical protein [Myxococcus sp. RHSTA-1-4]
MSVEWNPVFVLPNIKLEGAVEGGEVALVPADDERIEDLRREHPSFAEFLRRFSDAFEVPIEPAVLLVRADAPKHFFNHTALVGFRNLIAHSVIPHAHARRLAYSRQEGIYFGNSFTFHPWMVGKNDKYVVATTPAFGGIHELMKFRGQSTPEVPVLRVHASDLDMPLLKRLLERWRRWSGSEAPAVEDEALFRSLNMALHASMLPAGSDAVFYDQGRLIALWISAFEILVHPGVGGTSDLFKVFDCLELVPWELRGCKERKYPTRKHKKGSEKEDRTLASWLYELLYKARNDFLHGNPVLQATLQVPGSNHHVIEYAAPLYRLALTSFLSITFNLPLPPESDVAALAAFINEETSFMGHQRKFEEALLTSQPLLGET